MNDEQGRMDGNAHAPALGCKPDQPPSAGQQLLQEGLLLLGQGDRTGAAQVLARARSERDTLLQAHALIESNDLVGSFRNIMGLDCTISHKTIFLASLPDMPPAPTPCVTTWRNGWRTLSELMLLLEAVGQPLLQTPSLLEFASGHGRFTRHLVKVLGPSRVTVSDVVPDAVGFATQTFGVQGFMSASVPEQVMAPALWGWCLCCRCSATCRAAPGHAGSRCYGMRWSPVACWCSPPTGSRRQT